MATTVAFGEAVVYIKGDMRELAAALGQSRGLVDDFAEEADKSGKKAVDSFKGVDMVLGILNATLMASGRKAGAMADSWMYAAGRLETLEISLQNVGRMAGYSETELFKYRDAIKSMGIETKGATQAALTFIQSQLDLSKASQLARVAQDLAVIAGTDSTQMFNRMTQAISMQRPILLRAAGITTGLTEIYAKHSKETGIAVKAMDAQMKKTAMLNFLLEYGEKAFGTYDSAMGSAYKQMGSMTRYADEMKNMFGKHLQPVFMAQVNAQKKFYQTMVNLNPEVQAFIALSMKMGGTVAVAVGSFGALVSTAKILVKLLPEVKTMTDLLNVSLAFTKTTILPLIAIIAGLTVAYIAVTKAVKQAGEEMTRVGEIVLKDSQTYEEYRADIIATAREQRLLSERASETQAAMILQEKGILIAEDAWVRYQYGIDGGIKSQESLMDGMLNMGVLIRQEAQAEAEEAAKWAQYATAQRLAGLAEEHAARQKDIAQAQKWAKVMNDVFKDALDSAAEYEEGRMALMEEADQSIVEMTEQFGEEQALAQARHYQNLAQLEAQWQADRGAATAAGDLAELQKIDTAYQEKLLKQQTNWANRKAMDQQENALDLARLQVANAQKAHVNEIARLQEIAALKKQMAQKFAIEFMASKDWMKMDAADQLVFMQQMDANFGLRLEKEAIYAKKAMGISTALSQGRIDEATATGLLLEAIEEATDEALISTRAKAAQKAIDDAQAALAALVAGYGIAGDVIPDYVQATTAAGAATGGMAEQTETAIEALEGVVSSLKGVATEALELVTDVLGFELPAGFEEGFQNIADAMVTAVQVVYDAWQRGEGKAKQAGKFADHVQKIFEGMKAAADFMRQSERPAKLVTEAVTRVADFIDLSVEEMDKMATKYEEEGLLHMERFGLAVQSIVSAMGAAFSLMQGIRQARMVEAAPEELFTFMDSLVQGLKKIALPEDLGDLAKLRIWSEAVEAILSPIQTAIDVATKLAGFERVSGLATKVRQVMDGVDEILGAMLGALSPWGTHEMYSIDALRQLIGRQVELINVWAVGVNALNNAIGPAVDVVKKLADYETPEDLAEKAQQVIYDAGQVFHSIINALVGGFFPPTRRGPGLTPDEYRAMFTESIEMLGLLDEMLTPLSSAVKSMVETINALSTYTRVQNIEEKVARLVYDIGIVIGEFGKALEDGLGLAEDAAINATAFAEQMGDIVTIVTGGLDAIAALQDYTAAGAGFELRVQAFLDDLVRIVNVLSDAEDGLPAFPVDLLPIVEDFATGFGNVASIAKDGLDVIAGLRDYVAAGSGFATRVMDFIADVWTVVDTFNANLIEFPAMLTERAETFAANFANIASIISDGIQAIEDLVNMPGLEDLDDQTDTFLSALLGSARAEGGLMGILPKFSMYLHDFEARFSDLAANARRFKTLFTEVADLVSLGVDTIDSLVNLTDVRTLDDQTDTFLSSLIGSASGEMVGIVRKFDAYLAYFDEVRPNLLNRASGFAAALSTLRRHFLSGALIIERMVNDFFALNLESNVNRMLASMSRIVTSLTQAMQLNTTAQALAGQVTGGYALNTPTPTFAPSGGGTTIDVGGINVQGGGLIEYQTAQRVATAIEQMASSRGANVVRSGYRR